MDAAGEHGVRGRGGMGNRKEERNGGRSCILRFVNFTECRIKLHSESSYGLSIQGNSRKLGRK